MQDITTLCLLAVFVLVGFMLLSRMLGRMGGGSANYPRRGPYNPTVDDPNIRSGGAMGRPAQPTQRDESSGFPGRQGGSLFPSSGSSQSSESGGFPGRKRSGLFPPRESSGGSSGTRGSSSNRPQNDDPDIESRGGFGRPKK